MIGYSHREVFSARALYALDRATALVEQVRDDGPAPIRCHELARAVASVLDLPVVDGKFGIVDHSWCLVPNGRTAFVLDVYAVGSLPQVQLIDTLSAPIRSARQYVEGPDRDDVDARVVERLVVQMTAGWPPF